MILISILIMIMILSLQETIISECEEEAGNFLSGPEWKVRITTKADQQLDVEQVATRKQASPVSITGIFSDSRWRGL